MKPRDKKTPLHPRADRRILHRMDNREERIREAIADASEWTVPCTTAAQGKPAWCADVPPDTDDPVLRAIAAAPYVPISDEEMAFLDELERSTTRWLSSDEFLAEVGLTQEDLIAARENPDEF